MGRVITDSAPTQAQCSSSPSSTVAIIDPVESNSDTTQHCCVPLWVHCCWTVARTDALVARSHPDKPAVISGIFIRLSIRWRLPFRGRRIRRLLLRLLCAHVCACARLCTHVRTGAHMCAYVCARLCRPHKSDACLHVCAGVHMRVRVREERLCAHVPAYVCASA